MQNAFHRIDKNCKCLLTPDEKCLFGNPSPDASEDNDLDEDYDQEDADVDAHEGKNQSPVLVDYLKDPGSRKMN